MDGARPVIEIEAQIRASMDAGNYSKAFDLLMSHFQNKVFRLAYSMLGNDALAQETTQDIFVRIWKALASNRGQSSLSTWIYAIARNTCLTARGAGPAKRTVSIESVSARAVSVTRTRETDLDLELLLARLPENYRRVVKLFYMEDKSYEEVSRLLDLPMGTVKTYLHRARKQLAAEILEARIKGGSR